MFKHRTLKDVCDRLQCGPWQRKTHVGAMLQHQCLSLGRGWVKLCLASLPALWFYYLKSLVTKRLFITTLYAYKLRQTDKAVHFLKCLYIPLLHEKKKTIKCSWCTATLKYLVQGNTSNSPTATIYVDHIKAQNGFSRQYMSLNIRRS